MCTRSLIAVTVVAMVLLLPGCADVIAPSAHLQHAQKSVMVAPADTNFIEESRISLSGTKLPNGACKVGWEIRGKVGDSGTERVVQLNTATCDFVLARGRLRARPTWAPGFRTRVPLTTMDSFEARSSTTTLDQTGSAGIYQEIWHQDPPGFLVTQQRYWFQWTWNLYTSGCVNRGGGYQEVTWAYGSGWQEPTTAFGQSHECDSTAITAYADFHNPYFCGSIDTYVHYEQSVTGYREGGFLMNWYGTAWGGCSDLLTLYHDWYSY